MLLTNIFHRFDMATSEKLMRRVHAALKAGAAFSLTMLAGTDSGDAYTFSQYEKMFRNAGFARTTEHAVPESPQQLLLLEK